MICWWFVELPYWFKADFCLKFWEYYACRVKKIILYEVRFNPHEVKWTSENLENWNMRPTPVTYVILHSLIFILLLLVFTSFHKSSTKLMSSILYLQILSLMDLCTKDSTSLLQGDKQGYYSCTGPQFVNMRCNGYTPHCWGAILVKWTTPRCTLEQLLPTW